MRGTCAFRFLAVDGSVDGEDVRECLSAWLSIVAAFHPQAAQSVGGD